MKYHQKGIDGAGNLSGQPPYGYAPPAEAKINRKSSARGSGFNRLIDMLDNNLWLLSGITLVITALIIGWWILSGHGPGETRLFNNAEETSQQTDTVANQAIEQLEDQLTGLVDRVEMLTDSITYLESKLIRAHVLTDSIITAENRVSPGLSKQQATSGTARVVNELPPSASVHTAMQTPSELVPAPRVTTVSSVAIATSAISTSRPPDRVMHGAPARRTETMVGKQSTTAGTLQDAARPVATESQAPVSRHQNLVSTPKGGHWVINLTSSPSQTDADRFATKALSRGIETQQQQVTVKGKRYWRVQTLGFSTADDAQSYAGIVTKKLGLQDVWITRR